jgi:hypothetical protein
MTIIGRGIRALAIGTVAITAVVAVTQAPRPAYAADVGTAVGLGILGGAVAGAAIAGATANPYYAPGYYPAPYGYAPPAPAYYPPQAPYYQQQPRSCWDSTYQRYYQC